MLTTSRLRLVPWNETHRAPFVALCADPEVMADLGGPIDADEALDKLDRYRAAYHDHGTARFAVEDLDGQFLGYVGVMPESVSHPLEGHYEIGWRLHRHAWGDGYATEAATAALDDFFQRFEADDVLAYTLPDNDRSRAVMTKLGLERRPDLDFDMPHRGSIWHGLVWIASRKAWQRAHPALSPS